MQYLFVMFVSASSCCVQSLRSLHQTPPDTNTNCPSITPGVRSPVANQRRGEGPSDQSEAGYLSNCMSITPRVMTLGHSPLTRYDEPRGEYSARTMYDYTQFVNKLGCQATHAALARGETFPNTCYHNLPTAIIIRYHFQASAHNHNKTESEPPLALPG